MCFRWTMRVACLCPLGASSSMVGGAQPSPDEVGSYRFVSPSLVALCSFGQGRGCWRWKAFYAASMSLGPGILRPAFVAHLPIYALGTLGAGHCGSESNGAWLALHRAMTFIFVGLIYTMVMVVSMSRRVSPLPARCWWMSVYVAGSGPC